MEDPERKTIPTARRWTLLASALLVLALGLVVIYTSRGAFFSPLALVVVSAIGLAAVLLQIRLRRSQASSQSTSVQSTSVRAPLWLNVLGIACAGSAFVSDFMRLRPALLLVSSLGAVLCFGISSMVVLRALRRLPL
ncbi:MAG TPA: hypothetical protein VFO39_13055 [Candidatus Sulfotelmatobacter sp.]|nr:hypothetical protein [Candidatus Sulfotelmatobacter sp.]